MVKCILTLLPMFILSAQFADASTFDERLWEKYAGITAHKNAGKESLASIVLTPHQLGDQKATPPFSDLRIMNDRKDEIPWQIIQRRPAQEQRELPATQRNLSRTPDGETWVELVLDPRQQRSATIEVFTPDTVFSRQVQVMGSPDGSKWNTLRKDGIIFDNSRIGKVRLTRISYPAASFRYIALKIADAGAAPLNITGIKVFETINSPGETHNVYGNIEKCESDDKARESRCLVTMSNIFPIDRISILTPDRNYQRTVEVQVKRNGNDWQTWATGTVYNFDTDKIHEARNSIEMPEIATKEFRLIFRNFDSPPLKITGLSGEGHSRRLVYKHDPARKFYLFWGNPKARMPQYDLAGLTARENVNDIPLFQLESTVANSKFTGDKERLPFTERYKSLLYGVVALAILGLLALQYRVFKQMGKPS